MSGQILNTVLQNLLDQIALAYGNLLPIAYYFLYAFATITLVRLGLGYALEPNGSIITQLITKLFKIGFIFWLISNLPYLHEVLRDGAMKLGIRAAGTTNTLDLMLNPSAIAEYGFKVIMPIRVWLHELSWSVKNMGSNLVNILFGLVAIVLILGAFFYLAYQVFMALIDFYFTTVLAPIFLAFQVFEATAWMAVGAIRGPIQHAVKLFTMTFIISLAEPWIGTLLVIRQPDFSEVGGLVLAALVLVALALKAGAWSAGMFNGSPTASAGDLVATSAAIVSTGLATSAGGRALIGAAKVGSTVAGATIGGLITTGAAAITGAQLRGASYLGNSGMGKVTEMAYGAAQGAVGALTPHSITERISQSFSAQVAAGTRAGYMATGGVMNNQQGDRQMQAGLNAAKQAKMYQRIADAFKAQQPF